MSDIKLTYFAKSPIVTPLMHLRTLGPCQLENIDVLWVSEYQDLQESWFTDKHLIIIQRNFPGNLPLFRKIYDKATSLKLPIIYDIDDFLFELPEDHPDKAIIPFIDSLLPMFEALVKADAVTVSTHALKDRLEKYNKNIFVLPNFLDDSLWPFHLPIIKKGEESLTIGYMGGDSHQPDIAWITPVLMKINQAFTNKITFHFYGLKPPQELSSLPNVQWTPIRTYDYREFVDDFHHLDFDIFIAPLIDNPFNRCKSAIKFLEYSTLGVPGVYSDLEPYNSVVKDGENGFLASTLDEWHQKLTKLINDHELRFRLAESAQRTVRENWLMSRHSSLWTKTFNKIIKKGPISQAEKTVPIDVLQSISMQLFETNIQRNEIRSKDIATIEHKDAEVKALQTQVTQLHQTHQALSDELESHKNNSEILNQELKEQQATIEALNAQLVEYRNNNELLRNELNGLNLKLQTLDQRINQYKAKIGQLNAETTKYAQLNQALHEQLDQRHSTIETLNNQLNEAEHAIKHLEEQIAGQKQIVLSRDEQIEKLQQSNQSLISQLGEQDKKISALIKELDLQVQSTRSLDEKLREQDQNIGHLNLRVEQQLTQLDQLNQQLDDRDEEILFYSLSKSWRFTRPLRKLAKFFKGREND